MSCLKILDDTKIGVNGVKYRKVGRLPEELDLIRLTESFIDNWYNRNYLTANGLYEVIEVDEDGDFVIIDDDNDALFISKENLKQYDFEVYGRVGKGNYEVGDKVFLTDLSGATMGFEAGKVYEITDVNVPGQYFYEIGNDKIRGYVNSEHIKLPRFKVGDVVVIVDNTYTQAPHHFQIGEIVKIKNISEVDFERPYICQKKHSLLQRCTEADLRLATESDLKWRELGRRVNEFKPEDLVMIIESAGSPLNPGEIYSITGFEGDGTIHIRHRGSSWFFCPDYLHLICPAESRLDK